MSEINKNSKISIAVATYKRPEFLVRSISSILGQSYKNFEIIIGNNDESAALDLESLGISDDRIIVINREKNIGPLANMIDLMHKANGQYFTWLADDDEYLSPFFLQIMAEKIALEHNAQVLFSSYLDSAQPIYLKNFPDKLDWKNLDSQEFLHQLLLRKIKLIGNYGLWDLNFLKQIGGMKQLGTGHSPYVDNLLAIEAAYSEKIYFINLPMVFFRLHQDSTSFTSQDLLAYTSAQKDLSKYLLQLVSSISNYQSFNSDYSFFISDMFISHFTGVLSRSKSMQFLIWPSYFLWIFKEGHRISLFMGIHAVLLLSKQLIRTSLYRMKHFIKSHFSSHFDR